MMIKDYIPGTYWLSKDREGNLYLSDVKPHKYRGEIRFGKAYFLLHLQNPDGTTFECCQTKKSGTYMESKDFEGLKFPKNLTYETSPIEIEIGKTGRVYTYE